jgi:hypothetical protein
MTRVALLLAAAWLSAGSAGAGPPKVDRTLAKEPAYQTKAPRYGLLVFGPEGKDRVWLVHDGDALYVDRNGNGDLTEPGEKVLAEKRAGGDPAEEGYSFQAGDVTVGGRTHKGLVVGFTPLKRYAGASLGKRPDVKAALAKDPKAAAVNLGVDVEVPGLKGGGLGGRAAFSAGPIDLTGVFLFADKPGDAPAVHLGGPLQITFYAELPTLRVGRGTELGLVVGTPGVGPGSFAMLGYEDTIPKSVKPVAEVSLPPAKPGAPPLKEKWVIESRC